MLGQFRSIAPPGSGRHRLIHRIIESLAGPSGARPPWRTALAIAALLLLPLAAHADTRDATLLGAGPATSRAECPAGTVMVGVIAQADQAVTLVVPECASVVNGFAWQSGGVFSSGAIGASNPGGPTQNATCEPGSFVVSVGANFLTDPAAAGMLWIACQTSPASGAPRGGPVILSANPGAAIASSGVSQCNPDEAATGIAGAATGTVGAVGLICTPLATFAAPSDMIAGGAPADGPGMATEQGAAGTGDSPGIAAGMAPGESPGMGAAGPGDAPDMGMATGPGDAPGMATTDTSADTPGAAGAPTGPGSDADTLAAFDAAVNNMGQSATDEPGAASGGPGAATGPGSDGVSIPPVTGPGSGTAGTAPGDLPPATGGGGPGDPGLPSADVAALQPVPVQPGQPAPVTAPAIAAAPDWKTLPQDKLTQAANLRDAPSMDSTVLKAVPGGTIIHYSEHEKSWCHVFYDGGEGWVSTNYVGCGLPKVAKSTKTKKNTGGTGTASTTQPSSPPIFGTITLPNGLEITIGQ